MRTVNLVVTMGDPAGIGPEVICRALKSSHLRQAGSKMVVVGNWEAFRASASTAGALPEFSRLPRSTFLGARGTDPWLEVPCADSGNFGFLEVAEDDADLPAQQARQAGGSSAAASRDAEGTPREGAEGTARLALQAIQAAIELLGRWRADALVTAPVSKEALASAGIPFWGHTEFLAARSGSRCPVMTFVRENLRIALVTRHIAIRKVSQTIEPGLVQRVIEVFGESLRRYFGIPHPRLALCGLNPHAGEAGYLGSEEKRVLGPAVEAARAAGWEVTGPLPADRALAEAVKGHFDGVVAQYHDQAMIPIKLLGFERACQLTLGLPYVRTSPAHGTAYDIAGKGIAKEGSMVEAIRLAWQLGGADGKLF